MTETRRAHIYSPHVYSHKPGSTEDGFPWLVVVFEGEKITAFPYATEGEARSALIKKEGKAMQNGPDHA